MIRRPPRSPLFPYPTLFQSAITERARGQALATRRRIRTATVVTADRGVVISQRVRRARPIRLTDQMRPVGHTHKLRRMSIRLVLLVLRAIDLQVESAVIARR